MAAMNLFSILRRAARPRRLIALLLVALAMALWTGVLVHAGRAQAAPGESNLNIPTYTFGGKQFWSDERLYGGWRIQRNALTGHCRLLDAGDVRRAWGSYAQCKRALDEAVQSGAAVLPSRKLCILLHGYLRSKDSFGALAGRLEAAGFTVYSINYPSTQHSIEDFAKTFGSILDQAADDFDETHVITHSLGGIIARACLSDPEREFPGRLVMLAPPNQGAVMADTLLGWWPSEYVIGPSGKALSPDGAARQLGAPRCEFGIIAGTLRDGQGMNPLIPGDDDGLVGVEETKLDGMTDFATVNAAHTFIMNHEDTARHVLHFLEHGAFEATQ